MAEIPPREQSIGALVEAVCDRFEAAWHSHQRPRIEDYLAECLPAERPRVWRELMLLELEFRQRRGELPSAADYRDRFPDLQADLNEIFDPPERPRADASSTSRAHDGGGQPTAQWPGRAASEPSAAARERQPGDPPTVLGDYNLLRVLGHGGMGVVYLARQRSTHRVVALKLIRQDRLATMSSADREQVLRRFQTEVRVAARMQHEHVVTVYEAGQEQGYCYYSMRYVAGGSLADRLRDGPLEGRQAAALLAPVAEALDEAHRVGALHRDVTPRNLLVDDKTGQALVADFGLAKWREDEPNLTAAGDVFGSPPYLSPEQARNSAEVTAATDIYGLGATLYHAITGRPPFRAATAVETIRQVIEMEPVPPRQLNPAIDRDLETICLKCLDKAPLRRYASAGDLADDLKRYLADQPIRARPLGATGRAWRWCRRNPTVAMLVIAVVVLMTAVLVVAVVGLVRENWQRRLAEERDRQSRRNLNLAREAAYTFLEQWSQDPRLRSRGLEPLRREVLEASRDFYDVFARQQGDDLPILVERGRAYGLLAKVTAELGETQRGIDCYQQASDIFADLARRQPEDAAYALRLAELQIDRGVLWRDLGQLRQAETSFQRAQQITRQWLARLPAHAPFQAVLADSHHQFGILHRDRGDLARAESEWRSAIDIASRLVQQQPDAAEYADDLAKSSNNLAVLLQESGRAAEAEDLFLTARRLWEQRAADEPAAPELQLAQAQVWNNLGVLYRGSQRMDEAEAAHRSALKLRAQLAHEHPDVPDYQNELAATHGNLGVSLQDAGRYEEAAAAFQTAVAIGERLTTAHPDVTEYGVRLATSLNNFGSCLVDQGDVAAARQTLERARSLFQELVLRHPEMPVLQLHLAGAWHNLGLLHEQAHDQAAADKAFQEAARLQGQLPGAATGNATTTGDATTAAPPR